jgi:hypothetical protein
MAELHRILKIDGTCIIQTPFKEGDIFEDPSIRTPEKRLTHYGQSDHMRIYSVIGLKERLMLSGFQVEVNEFNESVNNKFGFKEKEYILVAKRVLIR